MREAGQESRRYIVLPDYGFSGRALSSGLLATNGGHVTVERRPGEVQDIRIIDGVDLDGPKLVEMTASGELALRSYYGSKIQIVPVTHYRIPRPFEQFRRDHRSAALAELAPLGTGRTTLRVVERGSGRPLPGARVVAFTLFRHKEGDESTSDGDGRAELAIRSGTKIERLYVFPPDGYHSLFRTSINIDDALLIELDPIDLRDPMHAVPRFYGSLPMSAGRGVTVGIIDTGIDKTHPDLAVEGGRNCVFDEVSESPAVADDFGDVDRHGTHVAGIIASKGAIRGVAPGVTLQAYRVFPKQGDLTASNYDIVKAIAQATRDGCDILNLSLGGPVEDRATRKAIEDAARNGVLVVAAAGNDNRGPLNYPANYEQSIAVTAIGLADGVHSGSVDEAHRMAPYSPAYSNIFFAGFSNYGPLVDLTAPGVGICSTVPGGRYGTMSGTSMAAPVVSGFAAHLLASHQSLQDDRSEQRRNELVRLLYASAVPLRLGRQYEGFGFPLPDAGIERL